MSSTKRTGGKFELAGFLIILLGMAILIQSAQVGGSIMLIGFIIFLAGRFM